MWGLTWQGPRARPVCSEPSRRTTPRGDTVLPRLTRKDIRRFQSGPPTNTDAADVRVQVFGERDFLPASDKGPGVRLLGGVFKKLPNQLSEWPPRRQCTDSPGSPCPPRLAFCLWGRRAAGPHYSFTPHFSKSWWCWTSSRVLTGPSKIFGKYLLKSSAIFSLNCLFSYC